MTADDKVFARRVAIAILLVGAAAFICYAANLLLLVFAGILGAVIANAVADWVSRRTHLSRRAAYFVVLLGGLLLVVGASWWIVPRVVLQLSQLSQVLPKAFENAQHYLDQFGWGRAITSRIDAVHFDAFSAKLAAMIRVMVTVAIEVTVTIVLIAYLAADPGFYKRGALMFLPAGWRPKANQLFLDIAGTLRSWLLGQLIPMGVLGVVTLIGLLVLNIPLAFTLSLFTGVLIFIPFAGAVIAFLATALVTLSYNPAKLLWVCALFLLIHVVEGYILTPLVQKRAVYLPPALTIAAQVLMSTLFGFLGLILATPLTAATRVAVRTLYFKEPRAPAD